MLLGSRPRLVRSAAVALVVALVALLAIIVSPGQAAWAASCASPQQARVASGGTVSFDCSPGGFSGAEPPAHGTLMQPSTVLTYTNGGDGATSDAFSALDDTGTRIQFQISVDPEPLTVSTAAIPDMTVGQATSQTLQASGGTAPYAFDVVAGALPTGVTLSSSGVLSGTPQQSGTSTLTVRATDSGAPEQTAQRQFSITVQPATLVVAPPTLPTAQQGRAYSQAFSTSGGTAPYTYSIPAGALPAGMSLSGGGSLSGTPSSSGTFTFAVRVADGSGSVGQRIYQLTVAAAPTVVIGPATLANAVSGVAYAQTLTASGGTAPYDFALVAGTLPRGLALSAGQITGTPTTAGSYTFTVQATDAQGSSGARSYSVTTYGRAPGVPTDVRATPRDASALLTWTAPTIDGGSPIGNYAVTAQPGGRTVFVGSTSTVFTGLTNGVAYTFTVAATNNSAQGPSSPATDPVTPRAAQTITFAAPGTQRYGTSPTLLATASSGLPVAFTSTTASVCTVTADGALSFASAGTCTIAADQPGNGAVAPASTVTRTFTVDSALPGAPTDVTVTSSPAPAGQTTGSATVGFMAPVETGGAPVTSYTVTSTPGGITATGAGSPVVVTGLELGTSYTFRVSATNAAGSGPVSDPTEAVTLTAGQVVTFAEPGDQDVRTTRTLGATVSSGLVVSYDTSTPTVCSVDGGQLTADRPGTCTVTASQAGDAGHEPAEPVTRSFTVVVPGGAPTVTTPELPAPTRGTPYDQDLTTSGGQVPYTYEVVEGSLPEGLTLTADGHLRGTPTGTTSSRFTVRITDAVGQTATRTFTVAVDVPELVVTPSALPVGRVGEAFPSTALTTTGGVGPYAYAVTGGALPEGLELSASGVVTGTPTVAGRTAVTVTVTDAGGVSGTGTLTVVVSAATVAPAPPVPPVAGAPTLGQPAADTPRPTASTGAAALASTGPGVPLGDLLAGVLALVVAGLALSVTGRRARSRTVRR